MATLTDVQNALADAVESAMKAAGITLAAQVGLGQPFGPSLTEILGQNEGQVTVYPLPGTQVDRTSRKPDWKVLAAPDVALTAIVADDVVTFGGVSAAGLNIHAFVGMPLVDVYYQTVAEDTPQTIPIALAALINAAGVPSVVATPNIDQMTVTGSPAFKVNVGGSGTLIREIGRYAQAVRVSVWAPDPDIRDQIADCIRNAVGIATVPFLPAASDGSAIRVKWCGDHPVDLSQSSYSLYEHHFVFECEYPITQTITATQIEGVETTINSGAPLYTGG